MTHVMVAGTELEIDVRNERNGRGEDAFYAAPGRLVEAGTPAAVYVTGRDAYFDPDLMELDRGYPYSIEGDEYMAIHRSDGRVYLYELRSR